MSKTWSHKFHFKGSISLNLPKTHWTVLPICVCVCVCVCVLYKAVFPQSFPTHMYKFFYCGIHTQLQQKVKIITSVNWGFIGGMLY